jgi:rhamnosyltransferase
MKIAAIIASYNGSDCIKAAVESALPDVEQVIIVDNGSADETRAVLKSLESDAITVVYNSENRGLAAALNQGVHIARSQSSDAVLMLDQDSVLMPGSLEALKAALVPLVGIASTQYRVIIDGQPHGDWLEYESPKEIETCWNAGSLIPLSVFNRAGYYNEKLFVDFVDYEFGLRVRKAGLKILQVPQARLIQGLANITSVRHRWIRCFTSNYPAHRLYLIARSGGYFCRLHPSRKSIKMYAIMMAHTVAKVTLFESDKLSKLRMLFRGILSGMVTR